MKSVFVVQHEYEWRGHDEVAFIGVYATQSHAEAAVSRVRDQPGFRNWPDGFAIDEYTLGKDHWTEGFVIMVDILVPSTEKEGEYHAAETEWRPGDIYEICTLDDDIAPSSLAFTVGDLVRCEERTVDGNPEALVAVELVERGA